jgi:hypothetical protein
MLAADLSEHEFDIYLHRLRSQSDDIQGCINIACFNSPSNLTISGDQETIDRLKQLLDAYHSLTSTPDRSCISLPTDERNRVSLQGVST